MSDFGDFVKKKRLANQLTLREFCLKNGYDAGNHSKLERGLLLPPEGEKLERLASALGIKLTKPENCFDSQKLEEYYNFKELAEVERQPLKADIIELQSQLTEKDKKIQNLEAKVKELEDELAFTKCGRDKKVHTLEALLIEACEMHTCDYTLGDERCLTHSKKCRRCEFKNKPEIKKLLEGVKS